MRDLYKRLDISRSASAEAIRERLDRPADEETKADAAHVLLDPDRREVYDHCLRALHQIGRLRANLRLTGGDHWDREELADFRHVRNPRDTLYPLLKKDGRDAGACFPARPLPVPIRPVGRAGSSLARAVVITVFFLAELTVWMIWWWLEG